jgi:hypothetical protein
MMGACAFAQRNTKLEKGWSLHALTMWEERKKRKKFFFLFVQREKKKVFLSEKE